MTELEQQLQDELNRTIRELQRVTIERDQLLAELRTRRLRDSPFVEARRVRSVASREMVGEVYDVGLKGAVVDWDNGSRGYMVFESLAVE